MPVVDSRLAAYVLLIDADRILLTWFNGNVNHPPSWSMPGGGVDLGESVREAAVREAYEETGYHVAVGELLTEDCVTIPATAERRAIRSQRFIFAATITGGLLGTTEVGGTTDFAQWVPVAELPGQPRLGIVDVALRLLE